MLSQFETQDVNMLFEDDKNKSLNRCSPEVSTKFDGIYYRSLRYQDIF